MAEPARVLVPFPTPENQVPQPPRRRLRQFRALTVEAPAEVRLPVSAPAPKEQSFVKPAPTPEVEPVPPQEATQVSLGSPKPIQGLRASRLQRAAQVGDFEAENERRAMMSEMQNALREEMENRLAEVLELHLPVETKFSLLAWIGNFFASMFLLIPPPEEQYRLFQDARSGIKARPTAPQSGE